MLGEQFSLVDCCHAPVIFALALSGFDVGPYPALHAYYNRMRARPSWSACQFAQFEQIVSAALGER
jgi:glutathione S-transferase